MLLRKPEGPKHGNENAACSPLARQLTVHSLCISIMILLPDMIVTIITVVGITIDIDLLTVITTNINSIFEG